MSYLTLITSICQTLSNFFRLCLCGYHACYWITIFPSSGIRTDLDPLGVPDLVLELTLIVWWFRVIRYLDQPKHITGRLSPVICHLSLFTCHLSLVTCHFSLVTCHLSLVTCHLSPVNVNVSSGRWTGTVYCFGEKELLMKATLALRLGRLQSELQCLLLGGGGWGSSLDTVSIPPVSCNISPTGIRLG